MAARRGIDNTPGAPIVANLRVLAEGLERVRAVLGGRPIHVNSGYRCPALNLAIGGATKSKHMDGFAADIVCPEFGTPLEVCRAVDAAGIAVAQIIHELGRWSHIAFAPPGTAPHKDLLTIATTAQGYLPGLNAVA